MMLPPKSNSVWVLADGDSFYASCEIARRPELRWKPVVVVRNQVCLASSYEAKKYGIWLSVPSWDARKILKPYWGVFINSDMQYYESMSKKVFWMIADQSKKQERYSIDESFYEWTWLVETTEQAQSYALQIQEMIFRQTGLPVTFWIWRTRLLAKMACKRRKPYWVFCELDEEKMTERVKDLPIEDIPGIWSKRAKSVYCHTVGQFMSLSIRQVKERLHWEGLKLRLELHHYNARQIERKWWPTCIWRTKSYNAPNFTSCKSELRWRLMRNFENAYRQLLDDLVATKRIWVLLRCKDFYRYSDIKKLPSRTSERGKILRVVKHLFDRLYCPEIEYRTTSIGFSDLKYMRNRQENLFDTTLDSRREKEKSNILIKDTMDLINNKLGWVHVVRAWNLGSINKQTHSNIITLEM